MSNEISILKFTFQKLKKTTRIFTIIDILHACDGSFFAYVKRNINISEVKLLVGFSAGIISFLIIIWHNYY